MMEQLASWEISNSRDLAYPFGRAQIILTKYLRTPDTAIVSACKARSLDPINVLLAGIPLDEYIALVTALYSVLNVQKPQELIDGTKSFRINIDEFLARTKIPRDHCELFVRNRARTIHEFRRDIAAGGLRDVEDLRKALTTDAFHC